MRSGQHQTKNKKFLAQQGWRVDFHSLRARPGGMFVATTTARQTQLHALNISDANATITSRDTRTKMIIPVRSASATNVSTGGNGLPGLHALLAELCRRRQNKRRFVLRGRASIQDGNIFARRRRGACDACAHEMNGKSFWQLTRILSAPTNAASSCRHFNRRESTE